MATTETRALAHETKPITKTTTCQPLSLLDTLNTLLKKSRIDEQEFMAQHSQRRQQEFMAKKATRSKKRKRTTQTKTKPKPKPKPKTKTSRLKHKQAPITMSCLERGMYRGQPDSTCPTCKEIQTDADIVRGFSASVVDYKTQCSKCGCAYYAKQVLYMDLKPVALFDWLCVNQIRGALLDEVRGGYNFERFIQSNPNSAMVMNMYAYFASGDMKEPRTEYFDAIASSLGKEQPAHTAWSFFPESAIRVDIEDARYQLPVIDLVTDPESDEDESEPDTSGEIDNQDQSRVISLDPGVCTSMLSSNR
jgi:hypothetical protein